MSRGAPVPTVVGLGQVVELVVRLPDGRRQRVSPVVVLWLAWHAETRDLLILRSGRGARRPVDGPPARRHAAFHGAAPTSARPMERPEPQGEVRPIGLLESLTYRATGIASPSKGTVHWIHHFGDRGEHGHGPTRPGERLPYGEKSMPRLDADTAGNLFIVRRPGNRFTVRGWILA